MFNFENPDLRLQVVTKNFLALAEEFEDIDPVIVMSQDLKSRCTELGNHFEQSEVSPCGALVMLYLHQQDKIEYMYNIECKYQVECFLSIRERFTEIIPEDIIANILAINDIIRGMCYINEKCLFINFIKKYNISYDVADSIKKIVGQQINADKNIGLKNLLKVMKVLAKN